MKENKFLSKELIRITYSGKKKTRFYRCEVLNKVSKEYIDRIYLCWYGNREITYDKNKTVFPKCNESEYKILMEFYKEFNMRRNIEKRMELLSNINLKFL